MSKGDEERRFFFVFGLGFFEKPLAKLKQREDPGYTDPTRSDPPSFFHFLFWIGPPSLPIEAKDGSVLKKDF